MIRRLRNLFAGLFSGVPVVICSHGEHCSSWRLVRLTRDGVTTLCEGEYMDLLEMQDRLEKQTPRESYGILRAIKG